MISRLLGIAMLMGGSAIGLAAPIPFNNDMALPPVVSDSTRPAQCTIAYLVSDISTNDVFATRMRIASTDDTRPVGNRMPCPSPPPPRLGARALDSCQVRNNDPNNCVYSDMGRGFEREPREFNTASNASSCGSDRFEFVGIACWTSGTLEVCSVSCGQTEKDARELARLRCEDKHQRSCRTSGAVPINVP